MATRSRLPTGSTASWRRPGNARRRRLEAAMNDEKESTEDPGTDDNVPEAMSEEEAAQMAAFENLEDDAEPHHGDVNLELIQDVPVTLAMEVGRTEISIRNLLQLNQGSVVELDRTAGEPLDVYVNGTLVAHGEVVVVNEKFGIRLTDVISPSERIKKLQ
ncbi:flagellar motor switch protein FliN [Wenzhouxiangella limi]